MVLILINVVTNSTFVYRSMRWKIGSSTPPPFPSFPSPYHIYFCYNFFLWDFFDALRFIMLNKNGINVMCWNLEINSSMRGFTKRDQRPKLLNYSQFHKTLPTSRLQMHWISVRFYEMGDSWNNLRTFQKPKQYI